MIMKTRYIFIAIAILVASACSKASLQDNQAGRLLTITATQEDAQTTRSAVQDGGTQVYWEPGDAIKVFYEGTGSRFESTCTSNSTVSDFVGTISVIGGANEEAEPSAYTWGLYPYRVDATSDGNSVTTTLPSTQAAREGSLAQNTIITVARSANLGLAFYNVCGGLRFSLSHEGVKRVILEGNDGEALAGVATIAFEDGVPAVIGASEPANKITLQAPSGGSFTPGVWYYIVSLPVSFTKGFKLTFRTEEGTGTVSTSNAVSIKRGIFGSLANIDAGVDFSSGSGDEPEDVSIEIDGEFWDWANVPDGLTGTTAYYSFKVHNDSNYIYFYSRRSNLSTIWGKGGYFYYYIDGDNDPSTGINHDAEGFTGVTMYMYIQPFAGTAAAPEFATSVSGSAKPSSDILKSVLFAGAYTDSEVELEIRLPLSVAGIKKGDVIALYSWGNKSASDFKHTKLVYTVK